ncbi:MAG: hypothetical protein DMG05_26705, partial [Acidobacteria bacterium]
MDTIPGRKPTATRNFTNGFRHTKERLRNDPLSWGGCEEKLSAFLLVIGEEGNDGGLVATEFHADGR